MKVSKQQMVNGLTKYVKEEVINKITDKPLKIVIAIGITALETNPSLADPILTNDIVSSLLREDDGTYDIDTAFDVIKKTLDEYGDFPVTIPAIKFVSPEEKTLTFSGKDIKKIKDYIGGANS